VWLGGHWEGMAGRRVAVVVCDAIVVWSMVGFPPTPSPHPTSLPLSNILTHLCCACLQVIRPATKTLLEEPRAELTTLHTLGLLRAGGHLTQVGENRHAQAGLMGVDGPAAGRRAAHAGGRENRHAQAGSTQCAHLLLASPS